MTDHPKEHGLLFKPDMVRAYLKSRKTRRRLYVRGGEDRCAPTQLARRLANGLDSAPSGKCWNWMRSHNGYGYGTLTVSGRGMAAHRLAYELGVGPIPDGAWVLHSCDNPACINPEHLELGDQSKNMADCSMRHRTAEGERNGQARLTRAQVEEIRALREEGYTQDSLASRFGVTQATVWRVVHRKVWL